MCIASAFGTVQAAAGAGFDCFALVAFLTLYSSYLLPLSLVSFFVGFPLNFHCFVLFCFELHIEKRFFNFLKIQSKYVLHKQRVSREPRWKSEEGVGERGQRAIASCCCCCCWSVSQKRSRVLPCFSSPDSIDSFDKKLWPKRRRKAKKRKGK